MTLLEKLITTMKMMMMMSTMTVLTLYLTPRHKVHLDMDTHNHMEFTSQALGGAEGILSLNLNKFEYVAIKLIFAKCNRTPKTPIIFIYDDKPLCVRLCSNLR